MPVTHCTTRRCLARTVLLTTSRSLCWLTMWGRGGRREGGGELKTPITGFQGSFTRLRSAGVHGSQRAGEVRTLHAGREERCDGRWGG